jgi:O-antigen/teichoic acid export membrane protein
LRLPRGADDPLLRSAYSLILNVVLTSALGVAFWVAAARMFPAALVGRDSALVSAMLVVATVCGLNLSSGLLRFLPVSKLSPARVVLGSYAAISALSALGGVGFVLVAPRVSTSYGFLARDPVLAAFWALSVVSWGVFALQDAVLTALRRAPWVPVENVAFGVLKLAALPALLAMGASDSIFIAWAVPMIALLVPVNYAIFRRFIPSRPLPSSALSPVQQFGRRGVARFLANDYLAMILIQAGSTLLPVVVVGLIGSRQGAYFYMPFTIVQSLDTVFLQVFSSVTVEAAMAPDRLPELLRTTVRRFGALLVAGVAIIVAGAGLILLPFGQRYVHGGAEVLQLLAVASLFRAVINLYCAVCRIRGRAGAVLAVQFALFVLVMILTLWLGRRDGLAGVGVAWLVANGVVAGAVVTPLVAALRQRCTAPRTAPAASS